MQAPLTYAHVVMEAYKHTLANALTIEAGKIVEVQVAAIHEAIQPWRYALPDQVVRFERHPARDGDGAWADLIVGSYAGEEMTVDRTTRAPLIELPADIDRARIADLCRPVSAQMVNRRAPTSNSGVDPANKRSKSLSRRRRIARST